VGYFAEKSRDQFENGKRIENECARFFDISKKNANAVTGQNPHSYAS